MMQNTRFVNCIAKGKGVYITVNKPFKQRFFIQLINKVVSV